jgi:uncharacterized protein (TIGR02646 family)
MKLLNRPIIEGFLSHYNVDNNQWTMQSPTPVERLMIWKNLFVMQGYYCAYCDSRIGYQAKDKHIEHFFHKGCDEYRNLTFAWHNLFGCCEANEHCGHYKDRKGSKGPGQYDPNQLIKPDEVNPQDFLVFVRSGNVNVKNNLTPTAKIMAKETIRVFYLDHSTLVNNREKLIKHYQQKLALLNSKSDELSDEQYFADLDSITQAITKEPYQTAINQVCFY